MPDVISWDVASQIAKNVAGYFPEAPRSEIHSLEADLISVSPEAESEVAEIRESDIKMFQQINQVKIPDRI